MPSFYDINANGYLGGYRLDSSLPGITNLKSTLYALPRNNLALYLDAANNNSYPGSGTTWTDLSGNGKNGTLTSTSYSTNFGGIIVPTSAAGYVTLGDNFLYAAQSFSIAFFFFWNNNPVQSVAADADHLFAKGAGYTNGYILRLTVQGQLIFTGGQSGGNQSTSSYGSVCRPNEWHYVVFTRQYNSINNSTGTIYVNGVDVTASSTTLLNFDSSALNFRIAAHSTATPTVFSRTQWGVFLIYEKVLDQNEIWNIYELYRYRYGI